MSTRRTRNHTCYNIKKTSHDIINTYIYIYTTEKNGGFFQYSILHIMMFQALIKGYGRSKSLIFFPLMNKMYSIVELMWFTTFRRVTSLGVIVHANQELILSRIDALIIKVYSIDTMELNPKIDRGYILHEKLGRSLYGIFVHHEQQMGICLRVIYLQGTN